MCIISLRTYLELDLHNVVGSAEIKIEEYSACDPFVRDKLLQEPEPSDFFHISSPFNELTSQPVFLS